MKVSLNSDLHWPELQRRASRQLVVVRPKPVSFTYMYNKIEAVRHGVFGRRADGEQRNSIIMRPLQPKEGS